MRGWRVEAKTAEGYSWLIKTYEKPTRPDRFMTNIKKLSDEPLVYEVLFKHKTIAGYISLMPHEMIKGVYKSFKKHSGKPLSHVKRQIKVTLI